MSTKLILSISFCMIAVANVRAEEDFYRWFPSCKVYLQEHCDKQTPSIGARMNCYRNFMESSKTCLTKTRESIAYRQKKNQEMESQGRASIKAEASGILETNYTKSSGLKIDENDSRSMERIEAGKQLRNFTSFINRIMIPGIKSAAPQVDNLLVKAQELNQLRLQKRLSYNLAFEKFKTIHGEVLTKIKSMTSTFEAYEEYFRPRFEGLKHEQNRTSYVEVFEKSRLLVQEAFDIESSLVSLMDKVNNLNSMNELKKQRTHGVTKGELALQKVFQTRMKIQLASTKDRAELGEELQFYQKLCRHAYPLNPSICDSEQGL